MAPPRDTRRDAAAPLGSTADAERSAAHIAELVRRTAERHATPGSAPTARADVTQQPPTPALSVTQQVTRPASPPADPPADPPVGPTKRAPSRRILLAAGAGSAVLAVLVAGGVALSHPFGTDAGPSTSTSKTTSPTPASPAPAGYAMQVTDVITDCAAHARGRTEDSFKTENCVKATRLLATGQVRGRPVLFVVSRIEMASAEAAASIKQVVDSNGSGNLDDLLREDKTFPGAPDKMPSSGYASMQTTKVVTVAEAGFVDGGRSTNTDAALRAAAAQVAAMVSAQT